ncbi:MAG: DUF2197 domain-containing protein [Thermaerobacter sp.]|nr:DUF2197 domain-containing protein [Thermaerobacter sp.]
MQVKCQICGRAEDVPAWSEDFEKLKEGTKHPYICKTCQDLIRSDAHREKQR